MRRAYPGSARVNLSFHSPDNSAPNFTFRSHMVIFVQPHPDSNKTYLVDVGFGSSGLAQPLLLSEAEDNVVFGTSFTEKHKLICGADKESSLGMDESLFYSFSHSRWSRAIPQQPHHAQSRMVSSGLALQRRRSFTRSLEDPLFVHGG